MKKNNELNKLPVEEKNNVETNINNQEKPKHSIILSNKQNIMEVLQLKPTFFEIRNFYDAKHRDFYFQLSSDRHHDNMQTDNKLEIKHLNEIKQLWGMVIDLGDQFDAMQGKGDRRSNKSDLKNEDKEWNYFDRLVDNATDFRWPYANNIAILWQWNHESSVANHHETDLIGRLVKQLNQEYGVSIKKWLYTGWVRFVFHDATGGNVKTFLMHFDHWYWWSAPVTKWVIQTNRRATYLPQADIVISWHIHEARHLELPQEMTRQNGESYIRTQHHLTLPTYKEEYLKGDGYHRENWRSPKPLGAYILHFYKDWNDIKFRFIRQN